MLDNTYISQQIAENERLFKSKTRLSWIFCGCGFLSMIAVPLLCGFAGVSANAVIAVMLLLLFTFTILGGSFQSAAKKHKKEIQRLQVQQQQLAIQNNTAPIVAVSCKHFNGLPIAAHSACRLVIFQDRLYVYSGTMEFRMPIERIISMDIATKSQVEYILKQDFSRAAVGGWLFGDVGAIIGGMPQSQEIERTEDFLVITYNKEEAIQFITLGDVDGRQVIAEASKYIRFQPKRIEL